MILGTLPAVFLMRAKSPAVAPVAASTAGVEMRDMGHSFRLHQAGSSSLEMSLM
jgi:hypothetical protein